MLECILTLDYEIYGNGAGSLRELVYEPTEQLKRLFEKWETRFVTFVEVLELEKIDVYGTDPTIDAVKKQLRELYRDGFDMGLHLHPQWSNAVYHDGRWLLDMSEYNLCTLPTNRIEQIVNSSLAYMRHLLDQSDFTPLSFRAGNWLFQPTEALANVLHTYGVRIDSSVFKGGLQRRYGLDYRSATKNGYCWRFKNDVSVADSQGPWVEVPIYTDLVLPWKMATSKRLGLGATAGPSTGANRVIRAFDFLRFHYPLKLDFCRMTIAELTGMIDKILRDDQRRPESYKPIVAIGHTKDLDDTETIDRFLEFLSARGIAVSTFATAYPRLRAEAGSFCHASVQN